MLSGQFMFFKRKFKTCQRYLDPSKSHYLFGDESTVQAGEINGEWCFFGGTYFLHPNFKCESWKTVLADGSSENRFPGENALNDLVRIRMEGPPFEGIPCTLNVYLFELQEFLFFTLMTAMHGNNEIGR